MDRLPGAGSDAGLGIAGPDCEKIGLWVESRDGRNACFIMNSLDYAHNARMDSDRYHQRSMSEPVLLKVHQAHARRSYACAVLVAGVP